MNIKDQFGKYTYGQVTVLWESPESPLIIGKFCCIAPNVQVFLGGNHRTDWVTNYPFGNIYQEIFPYEHPYIPATKGAVTVGNDVWIASDVTIMSGVTIGDGAVIAANSHVVKDVAPYTFVGGNPAKFIRYRFTQEQIKQLLQIRWWDWHEDKINRFLPLICSDDIDAFIKAVTTSNFI